MDATCNITPQAEIILQGNCIKEMFLLMHKEKSTKSCRILKLPHEIRSVKNLWIAAQKETLAYRSTAMTWDKPMKQCLTTLCGRGAFRKKLPEKSHGPTQNISDCGFTVDFAQHLLPGKPGYTAGRSWGFLLPSLLDCR